MVTIIPRILRILRIHLFITIVLGGC